MVSVRQVLLLALAWTVVAVAAEEAAADAGAAGGAETGPSLAVLLAQGDQALANGKPSGAADAYTKALTKKPGDPSALYKRATAYLSLRKELKALKDLNAALQASPTFAKAYETRAKVHIALGRVDEAKADLVRVKDNGGDKRWANQQLDLVARIGREVKTSLSTFDSGKYDAARIHLASALELAPSWIDGLLMRAHIELEKRDYDAVVTTTGRVLKLDSDNRRALVLRGNAYYLLGEHTVAARHFKEALRADPENKEVKAMFKTVKKMDKMYKKAEESLEAGKAKDALDYLADLKDLDPMHQVFHRRVDFALCKAYQKLRRAEEGLKACDAAIRADPDGIDADAYIARAEIQMQLEEWEDAVRDWNIANQRRPRDRVINDGIRRAEKGKAMAKRKDHYKVLGVPRDATSRQIKKAYRKLALEYHPDHNKDERAKKKYLEIRDAYEILSDADKKRRYDNGEDIEEEMRRGGGGGGHPFGGFGGFPFGGFGGGGRPGGGGGSTFSFRFG